MPPSIRLTYVMVLHMVHLAAATYYETCNVKDVKAITLTSVMITPCDSIPCTLYKDKMASIDISFTSNADILPGRASVRATYGDFAVRFPQLEENICDFLEWSCPVVAGGLYTYSFATKLNKLIPSVQLKIRWELHDTEGESFICIEFPVRIA
ncbi:hypothetical protein CRM22_004888 [Opisthorchis felineus]|uniref:MD-2-related lipid-recognition domain-containing protein n=2 Tax=Opisthorchis felineus TaxID=147828 RepID=A0A4S2LV28_OPIFE|nr:hypothetical protein CRM22_004888 [Opisthorchis felineus]